VVHPQSIETPQRTTSYGMGNGRVLALHFSSLFFWGYIVPRALAGIAVAAVTRPSDAKRRWYGLVARIRGWVITRRECYRRVKAWATLDKFIYVWAVVVIGSNLQTLIHPHLDWVLTFLFAGLSVTRLVKERWEVPWVIVSGVTLMIASICMTAIVSPHPFLRSRTSRKARGDSYRRTDLFRLSPRNCSSCV